MARQGDHTAAARLFSRLVAVEPAGEHAWLKLAHSLHALGDEVAARNACREVLRLQPKNEEAERLILQLALSAPRALTIAKPLSAQGEQIPVWMRPAPPVWGVPQSEIVRATARS